MAQETYQRIVVGYHGCDAAVAEKVLTGKAQLKLSTNTYDWLGQGIYFWEHGPRRAHEWAVEQARLAGAKVKNPSVLAARIDLGVCLDLLDTANTRLLGKWYAEFRRFVRQMGVAMPENRDAVGSRHGEEVRYQTVRGVFLEGRPAFPGSKIALKSHIQIAVRDPACIVQIFQPKPSEYRSDG